jgi:protein-S-isoprenylcysteine O-methyltransferase Ste14
VQARKFWVLTVFQIAALGILIWFLTTYKTPWNVQRYIGTLLTVVCIGFMVVARVQLGKSFSVKPEAHELVTTGLYSKIRNPIYVFGTLMLVGLALVVQRPQMWILPGVAVIGQTIRARREARVLEAAFGDAYREYRRKTWF